MNRYRENAVMMKLAFAFAAAGVVALLGGCSPMAAAGTTLHLSREGVAAYCKRPPVAGRIARKAINTCSGAVYVPCPKDDANALADEMVRQAETCR